MPLTHLPLRICKVPTYYSSLARSRITGCCLEGATRSRAGRRVTIALHSSCISDTTCVPARPPPVESRRVAMPAGQLRQGINRLVANANLSKYVLDQRLLVDLAHGVAGYGAEYTHHAGHLVAGHPLLGEGLDVFQR